MKSAELSGISGPKPRPLPFTFTVGGSVITFKNDRDSDLDTDSNSQDPEVSFGLLVMIQLSQLVPCKRFSFHISFSCTVMLPTTVVSRYYDV